MLRCSGCGVTFPIICGLPILIPELKDYLRANPPHIGAPAKAHGDAHGEAHGGARPIALDVGCHVGRLTRELAPRCGTVLGLDLNFAAALTARRILLGWPRPFDGYDLYREGLLHERRSIALPPLANAEVIVGSGLSLPLRDGSIDVAVSTNVLDSIPAPALMLQEMGRSLREGGLIGNACIYMWDIVVPTEGWLGGKDGQESAERVRRFLSESFELIGEADYVPWVLHQSDTRARARSGSRIAATQSCGSRRARHTPRRTGPSVRARPTGPAPAWLRAKRNGSAVR